MKETTDPVKTTTILVGDVKPDDIIEVWDTDKCRFRKIKPSERIAIKKIPYLLGKLLSITGSFKLL